jgi:L-ascorbate metabolism protein UlaG (beta-lactamase superfamily)
MNLTWYGHSCFGIEVAGKFLLFDPFITENTKARHIDINTVPADYIFVSHGHGDHTGDTVAIAGSTGALVVAAYEVAEWLGKQGVKNYHPMNHGGRKDFDFGTVKCVSAIHSSVLPDGSYGGNPMGFVVKTKEKNFYYSGDTALTLDMQLIPKWAKLDFAVLCIGDNFTMGYEDALEAAKMVGCKKVIGVHYDTFGYITIDREKAKKAFSDEAMELILMEIGETIAL